MGKSRQRIGGALKYRLNTQCKMIIREESVLVEYSWLGWGGSRGWRTEESLQVLVM